jgi:hypothetical protein
MHGAIKDAIKALGLKPPSREELVRYVQAQNENDRFKQFVSAELGDQFFDYVDEDGTAQNGTYSYYNSLGYEAKKEFRASYPDEYDAIENYYLMRDTFAEDHPVWADYYGSETEPSVTLRENTRTGSVLTPPTLRSTDTPYRSNTNKGSGGGGRPEYRPTQSVYGDQSRNVYFNISDRTSTHISPGLYQLVGNKMAWEITNLFSSGKRISSAGVSFLQSVKSRYPQYASEIESILSKGT